MRSLKVIATSCFLCLGASLPTSAQVRVDVTASTLPLWNRSAWLQNAINAALDGSDRLLARTSSGTPDRRVVRVVKFLLLDVPVSSYFVSLNHELGHTHRANEQGIETSLQFVGGPWSNERFELHALGDYPRVNGGGPLFDLEVETAGLEASWILKDRNERRGALSDWTSGELLGTVWATLNTPLYAVADLPAKVGGLPQGDLARYEDELMRTRLLAGERFPRGEEVRLKRLALLNMLDYGLAGEVFSLLVDHVWRGHARSSTRWLPIGGFQVVPAYRFVFTPVGTEHSLRAGYRSGTSTGVGYVRWSGHAVAPPAGEQGNAYRLTSRRWGVGGSLGRPMGALRWDARADSWWGGHDSVGWRTEASVTFPMPSSLIPSLETGAGFKRAGWLQGFPFEAGGYLWVSAVLTR